MKTDDVANIFKLCRHNRELVIKIPSFINIKSNLAKIESKQMTEDIYIILSGD